MNTLNSEYDDVLRRALLAAAESIEPSGDGLDRIRARLSTPPLLSLASVTSWYSDFVMRVSTWSRPAIGAVLDVFWSVIDRFRPEGATAGHAGPRFGWLRPVAAMGTAIFVVAAGAFAIMTLPQAISSSGSFLQQMPWSQDSGSAGHAGSTALQGSATEMPTGPMSPGPAGGLPGTTPVSSKCSAVGSPTPTATPSVSASQSATPTPPTSTPPVTTPIVTPTDSTPGPTSTPTDSSTPDPGSTGTPTPATSTAAAGAASGDTAATVVTGTAALGRSNLAAALTLPVPETAVMRPSKSSQPTSPCPSHAPRKKKKKSTGPLALSTGVPGDSAKTS